MVHFSKKKKKRPEGRCWKRTVNCRSVLKAIIPYANEQFGFCFFHQVECVGVPLYANGGGGDLQNDLKKTRFQRIFLSFQELL